MVRIFDLHRNVRYNLFFTEQFDADLSNAKKRNKELARQAEKRLEKLRTSPEYGKPLSHDKAGLREVHIKTHWVILYRIDFENATVVLLRLGTHEDILGT